MMGVLAASAEIVTAEPNAFLEYVEATGTQYIDTGVNAETGLKARVDFSVSSKNLSGADWSFLGATTVASSSDGLLYRAKIWDGDELLRDFVPVVATNSEGVAYAGLYDMATERIYRTAGPVEFDLATQIELEPPRRTGAMAIIW